MAVYNCIATGGNWSNNATWGGGGHPVAGDTANLSALTAGNTVTIDTNSACEVLNMTGNAGTLAFGNYTLTVGASNTGVITLVGTTTAGTGGISCTGTTTLYGAGTTAFAGKLTLAASKTFTLAGGNNWTNTGQVSATTGTIVNWTTVEQLVLNGGFVLLGAPGTGTAPWDINSSTGTIGGSTLNNPMILNVAGDVTLSGSFSVGALVTFNAATNLKGSYTLTCKGITLNSDTGQSPVAKLKAGTSANYTANGHICYHDLQFTTATTTYTLVGAWINNGLVSIGSANNIVYNTSSAETLTCNGGVNITNAPGGTGNLVTIIWAGGTFTCTNAAYYIYNPFTINPTFGNVTFASGSYFAPRLGNLTYTHSGTNTVTTTGSTLILNYAISIATDDGTAHIVWDTLSVGPVNTSAIVSTTDLYCHTFNGANAYPIAGGFKMNAGTHLYCDTAANIVGNTIYQFTLQSASAASAYFVYTGTLANLNVSKAAFTWIDASGSSVPIYNYFGGTLSNTVNILNVTTANLGSGWFDGD